MKNRMFIVVIFLVFIAGCSLNKITPEINTYTLSPPSKVMVPTASSADLKSKVVQLKPADASRVFSGTNIIYRDQQQGFNSYAYSRWSDSPVNLLNFYLQQVLEQSQLFSVVIPPDSLSGADLLLESTLYDFSHHVDNKSNSSGVISIQFYLVDARSKKVITTKQFSAQVTAKQFNAEGAVLALNQAMNKISDELLAWLATTAI